jgi:ribonuclease HI
MKRIQIYTDGGCDKNPGGVGAWAIRLVDGDQAVERSGGADKTTNNRMELTAAIEAITLAQEHLTPDKPAEIEILTDSQYLARGMNEWIAKWQLHHWTLKDGSPVKNTDLWKRLLEMQNACRHRLTWTWVQGHAGDPNNSRVDRVVQETMKGKQASARPYPAQAAADGIQPQLKLIRKDQKPHAVRIFQKGSSAGIEIPWKHLLGFIEDLLRIQREGDEG